MKRFGVSKSGCIFLVMTLLWLSFPSLAVPSSEREVSLIVDRQPLVLPQPAILQNGRVMVPLRGVFEALGATVNYEPMTRIVTATRYGNRVVLALNSLQAEVSGESQMMDVPPILRNGAVMIPLRFVSEALGASVRFDPYIRTASILSHTGGVDVANPQESLPTPTIMGHFIRSVSLSPASAAPGENIVVSVNGTPGCIATLKLSNGGEINMRESSLSGYYIATYTVPRDFQWRNLDLTVQLQTPNGGIDTITQVARIEQ